jgi:hypothetical protein
MRPVGQVGDAEPREGALGRRAPSAAIQSPIAQRQLDVAADAHRQQAGALGCVPYPPAQLDSTGPAREAVDPDLAGAGRIEAADQPQQGGLSRSVRSEHPEPLTGGDVESVDAQHLSPATPSARS